MCHCAFPLRLSTEFEQFSDHQLRFQFARRPACVPEKLKILPSRLPSIALRNIARYRHRRPAKLIRRVKFLRWGKSGGQRVNCGRHFNFPLPSERALKDAPMPISSCMGFNDWRSWRTCAEICHRFRTTAHHDSQFRKPCVPPVLLLPLPKRATRPRLALNGLREKAAKQTETIMAANSAFRQPALALKR